MPRRPHQPVQVSIINEINHLRLQLEYLTQQLDAMQLPCKDVVGFDYNKYPMYDVCDEESEYEGEPIYDEELEYDDEPDVDDYDGLPIFDEDVVIFEDHPLDFSDSFNESEYNGCIVPPIFDDAPLEVISSLTFDEVPSDCLPNNFLDTSRVLIVQEALLHSRPPRMICAFDQGVAYGGRHYYFIFHNVTFALSPRVPPDPPPPPWLCLATRHH